MNGLDQTLLSRKLDTPFFTEAELAKRLRRTGLNVPSAVEAEPVDSPAQADLPWSSIPVLTTPRPRPAQRMAAV